VPKQNDKTLLKLQRENERQRHIIEDLNQQIKHLLGKIAGLEEQLRQALDGNAESNQHLKELQEKLDDLLFQIKNLTRQEHGPITEHHNPRQGPSPEDDGDQATGEQSDGEAVRQRLKSRANKQPRARNHKKHIFEQDLPEKDVPHPVSAEQSLCPNCQIETVWMSVLETLQIERFKNALVRLKHKQETRCCPKCDYIVTAEKPCAPIPGSYSGPCLLSSVIVDKFADALPNYRQTKRFRRENAIIPRQTQCDWIISASLTIEPLYELLKREVLSSKVVKTDDSWIKIQDRSLPSNMRKGKITSYVGDKRHPLNFFVFSPSCSFASNKDTLKDYKGFVQADAANGFDALFDEGSGRTEIGCNAHSRRKYWQCAQDEAYEMVCGEILDIYRNLYQIEKEIRDQHAEARLSARQSRSKPLTDTLREKIVALKDSLPPTNPLMKAVQYTLNHWDALIRFLDDPDFEIDNNACERAIKEWVLVRKASLFVGSNAGGKAAAIHLSFISSCNRLGIDPLEYLKDVYTRINSMKTTELSQLLPDRWVRNTASKPPP